MSDLPTTVQHLHLRIAAATQDDPDPHFIAAASGSSVAAVLAEFWPQIEAVLAKPGRIYWQRQPTLVSVPDSMHGGRLFTICAVGSVLRQPVHVPPVHERSQALRLVHSSESAVG